MIVQLSNATATTTARAAPSFGRRPHYPSTVRRFRTSLNDMELIWRKACDVDGPTLSPIQTNRRGERCGGLKQQRGIASKCILTSELKRVAGVCQRRFP